MLCITVKGFSEVNKLDINERKQFFYQSIDQLNSTQNNPKLGVWLRPYIKYDSGLMDTYYKELLSGYQNKENQLNSNQKIKWLYELAFIQTDYDSLHLAQKSLKKALMLTNKEKYLDVYLALRLQLAYVHRQLNQWALAKDILVELVDLAIQNNNRKKEIHFKYWLAEILSNLGEYDEALVLANELYEESMAVGDSVNSCYNLIQLGNVSAFIDNDTSYFEYYRKAINLANNTQSRNIQGVTLMVVGSAYFKTEEYKLALSYLERSLEFENDLTTREKINLYVELCNAYLEEDKIELAKKYIDLASVTVKDVRGYLYPSKVKIGLANYYQKTASYNLALSRYKEIAEVLKKYNNFKELSGIYKKMSDVNAKLENYELALIYLDSSQYFNNKLVEKNNTNIIAKARAETDYFIQKAEISDLLASNKIDKEKNKRLKLFIVALAVFLVCIVLFYIISRRQLLKIRESHINLVKRNLELDQANKKLFLGENNNETKSVSIENRKMNELYKELNILLYKKEIYINPDLSLVILAQKLNTNTSYLSAVINQKYNSNFKTLLNKLRVNKAKEILVNKEFENYSMEGIANEVGFKSRSGFYQSFKLFTGLTPTQYVANYQRLANSKAV